MNETLKYKELVEKVATEHELTKVQAKAILDYTFETFKETLKNENVVDIPGFGKFKVQKREARTGINPATGEKIKIAASKKLKFTAAKALKELVK